MVAGTVLRTCENVGEIKKNTKSGTEVSNIRFPYSVCSTMDRMEKTLNIFILCMS